MQDIGYVPQLEGQTYKRNYSVLVLGRLFSAIRITSTNKNTDLVTFKSTPGLLDCTISIDRPFIFVNTSL